MRCFLDLYHFLNIKEIRLRTSPSQNRVPHPRSCLHRGLTDPHPLLRNSYLSPTHRYQSDRYQPLILMDVLVNISKSWMGDPVLGRTKTWKEAVIDAIGWVKLIPVDLNPLFSCSLGEKILATIVKVINHLRLQRCLRRPLYCFSG